MSRVLVTGGAGGLGAALAAAYRSRGDDVVVADVQGVVHPERADLCDDTTTTLRWVAEH